MSAGDVALLGLPGMGVGGSPSLGSGVWPLDLGKEEAHLFRVWWGQTVRLAQYSSSTCGRAVWPWPSYSASLCFSFLSCAVLWTARPACWGGLKRIPWEVCPTALAGRWDSCPGVWCWCCGDSVPGWSHLFKGPELLSLPVPELGAWGGGNWRGLACWCWEKPRKGNTLH